MTPPEKARTRAPSADGLREKLKALPSEERGPGSVEFPAAPPRSPAHVADDRRPVMVKDDFVLQVADPVTDEEREAARAERRRRRALHKENLRKRKRRRIILTSVGTVLLLLVAFFGWVRWTTGGLDRIPAALNSGADTPGTTILLVGSDPSARDEVTASKVTWKSDLSHSDLVMLVHLPKDGGAMYGISLPGRLQLPLSDGHTGHIGSVMDAGGQDAYVDSIESVTGLHIDHLATLDMSGLQEVVDSLGGVDVQVQAAGCDEQVGPRTLDGQGALELMRYRKCLPNGDLDRVSRQQSVLKGILASLVDGLPNPFRLNTIARETFNHLAVDEDWGLLGMAGTAWSQRGMTPRTTTFLTVPTQRDARGRLEIAQSRASELWDAIRTDRLDEFVALNRELAH